MPRIVFIGAGSFGFTRTLVKDVLTFPLLKDSTIVLMDIDAERLSYISKGVNKILAAGNYSAKVVCTTNRAEALKGADAVICTILSGGVGVWRHDIEIPKKYGVNLNVGDTRGPSGIFRALRTIPVMLGICKDMERYCPNAILLNYTNPMAMLCHAMQKTSKITVSGLCHSVQGTAQMLAKWAGAPYEEVDYICAGINHQAWYLEFKHKNKDLYPELNRAVRKNKELYNQDQVRNEMFIHLGYYVTESSGHSSEYNAWFRKRPDLIKKYCTNGTGGNPGHYGYILDKYLALGKNRKWQKDIETWLAKPEIDIKRGHEYAAFIINAWMGGELFKFNGNVPNKGLISNLPYDACVEVPVVAGRNKLDSIHVGELPPQLAVLNNISVAIENMAVNAAIDGDAEMVFHAIAYDPLTSAVLSLAEIRKMVQEMLYKNRAYLPQFRNLKII
jgi:alpha-galactosidase